MDSRTDGHGQIDPAIDSDQENIYFVTHPFPVTYFSSNGRTLYWLRRIWNIDNNDNLSSQQLAKNPVHDGLYLHLYLNVATKSYTFKLLFAILYSMIYDRSKIKHNSGSFKIVKKFQFTFDMLCWIRTYCVLSRCHIGISNFLTCASKYRRWWNSNMRTFFLFN